MKQSFLTRDVEIEIILKTPKQHEVWVSIIRARIAPWNLLQQEMKKASGVKELEIVLDGLAPTMVGTKPFSMSTEGMKEKRSDILRTLPEQIQKLSAVDDVLSQGNAAVETGGRVRTSTIGY